MKPMSWSDDIRCLYCDGRLPLYRKITNGQFCSSAHRKAYWIEQERLAVERLHQTHDSLRAYRVPGAAEAILGTAAEPESGPALVPAQAEEERPGWLLRVNTGDLPVMSFVPDPRPLRSCWLEDRLAGTDIEPLSYSNPLRRPVAVYAPYDCGFAIASPLRLRIEPGGVEHHFAARPVRPLRITLEPVRSCARVLVPAGDQLSAEVLAQAAEPAEPVENGPAPALETLFHLTGPQAGKPGARNTVERYREPFAAVPRTYLPVDLVRLHTALSAASSVPWTTLSKIAPAGREAAFVPSAGSVRTVDFQRIAPAFDMATPALLPRLMFAPGRRYSVHGSAPLPAASVQPETRVAPAGQAVMLPDRAAALSRLATSSHTGALAFGRLARLACEFRESKTAAAVRPAPTAWTIPQPPRMAPSIPSSKLEPLDAKPVSDFVFGPPPPLAAAPPAGSFETSGEPARAHIWVHAIDFWRRAPRDMKMLVFGLPLLLGLALHPSLPKVRAATPAAAGGLQRSFTNIVNHQWGTVRQSMVERAAVALDEDFRAGLDDWVSRGDAPTDWSFDATGFVRPGPLAMYRPSMSLNDYEMQFLGMIDKKALSWVVRASDFENYYVIKLVVLKSGPLPTIGLTRYAVVNGKAQDRADTVVPVDARQDMLYRVRLDVHGDDFALSVQGQMVDSWSESRLTHGGIGFFTAPGEESRIRWVQVTHQYDMLGRLCAYLAPYNMTSTNGSWQQ
jgi:hypothetical protein